MLRLQSELGAQEIRQKRFKENEITSLDVSIALLALQEPCTMRCMPDRLREILLEANELKLEKARYRLGEHRLPQQCLHPTWHAYVYEAAHCQPPSVPADPGAQGLATGGAGQLWRVGALHP